MREPPVERARFDLGRSRPSVRVAASVGEGRAPVGLCLVSGALHCYSLDGELLWACHPPGLNLCEITAADDLDGNGAQEALVMAGRPTYPYGAAVLVSLTDGQVLWRYDVEPMSYTWSLHVGQYLPETSSKQIVVLMQGYPPEKDNGYIVLFDFPEAGAGPQQRWRYDFDHYTCRPSLLQTDLDGDGTNELAVETHSRMWFLDVFTGAVKHFVRWDVSPGNERSYGLVRFVDLDQDGRDDFLCIANFSQHHEVLLNRNGKMEKAWHYGWAESVTTGKVATSWPEPPYADLDGDGGFEVVVSMFNSEDEGAWLVRAYDAATGALKYRFPGVIAVQCVDVDQDGRAEILGNRSEDPTGTVSEGAALLKVSEGALTTIWHEDETVALAPREGIARIRRGTTVFALSLTHEGEANLEPWTPPPLEPVPDFSKIPPVQGGPSPVLLAADLDNNGTNELIAYQGEQAHVLRLAGATLEKTAEYVSSSIPVFADLDGNGHTEVVVSRVSTESLPVVEAFTPALENRRLWQTVFPEPSRAGLPQPRKAYIRLVHLTGRKTPDLYVWAGTPVVRSTGLDGKTGRILWEKGEAPNSERYWGPSMNFASTYDFNGDGNEDLVFTNPDYYCVADGPTGDLLLGPLFPPTIFNQPSQGLYTYPAILERTGGVPIVCLVAGHYFQAAMSLRAEPYWYSLPQVGENRSGMEAFLPLDNGAWAMGFGRQNGRFAYVNVSDGAVRWELPVDASASDAIACDVDGDGRAEFVFGTSHGKLYAVGDGGDAPRLVWSVDLGAGVDAPIAADLNGDGLTEIAVPTTDGYLRLLAPNPRPDHS